VQAEAKGVLHSLWTLFGSDEGNPCAHDIRHQDFLDKATDQTMQKFFALIGVQNYSPEYVFGLIDEDDDGQLSADEFLSGCARPIKVP
jgi:hypothetical protein